MTIITARIPDDVKAAFDKAFEGEDKDAVHRAGERGERPEVSLREAADEVLRLRKLPPYFIG